MQDSTLTARAVYHLLSTGFGTQSAPIPFLSKRVRFTQTDYWWSFLAEGVSDSVLEQYFDVSSHRSRALSNLMNRTVPHSMPTKLRQAMDEGLSPDNLLFMTAWVASTLDENMNPLAISNKLNIWENELYDCGEDTEFAELIDFFTSLRPSSQDTDNVPSRALFLQAALRISMLALHAFYGDQMGRSKTLASLRSCRFCSPAALWDAVSADLPRVREHGFSLKRAYDENTAETAPPETPLCAGDGELIAALTACAEGRLPPADIRAAHTAEGAGWYAVANWMDLTVNINDRAASTYSGAEKLGLLENGDVVYILAAKGYKGLHVSSGVWGKIYCGGRIGWVPMNFLIALRPLKHMINEPLYQKEDV